MQLGRGMKRISQCIIVNKCETDEKILYKLIQVCHTAKDPNNSFIIMYE